MMKAGPLSQAEIPRSVRAKERQLFNLQAIRVIEKQYMIQKNTYESSGAHFFVGIFIC